MLCSGPGGAQVLGFVFCGRRRPPLRGVTQGELVSLRSVGGGRHGLQMVVLVVVMMVVVFKVLPSMISLLVTLRSAAAAAGCRPAAAAAAVPRIRGRLFVLPAGMLVRLLSCFYLLPCKGHS